MRTYAKSSHLIRLFSLVSVLSVAGCGGTGNTTSNPFKGSWTGTWNRTVLNDSGQFNLVITSNGVITGTSNKTNNQGTTNGQAKGTITKSGVMFLRLTYPTATEFLNGTSTIQNEFVPLRMTGSGDISSEEFVYPSTWSLDKTGN